MVFPNDYFHARSQFREMASRLHWEWSAEPIPARGPQDQELTVDVATSPNWDADNLLIVSGGLHGIEGFFGSAVQSAFMQTHHRERWRNVRVLVIHAINPFGFAWLRRTSEDNVDLNRNFLLDGDSYSGCHPTYQALDPWLNPQGMAVRWMPFSLRPFWIALRHSLPNVTAAIAGGQYDFPKGLFFGGTGPTTSRDFLCATLKKYMADARHALHFDFHTGLGRWSTAKLLADEPLGELSGRWVRQLAEDFPVEPANNSSVAYPIRGGIGHWCSQYLEAIDYSYMCAEFGTYSPYRVLSGLRAENWAHHWSSSNEQVLMTAKHRLKELFCPQSHQWRRRVLDRSNAMLSCALERMSSSQPVSRHVDF